MSDTVVVLLREAAALKVGSVRANTLRDRQS